MLTVNRRGLPAKLRRSLACTNSIENTARRDQGLTQTISPSAFESLAWAELADFARIRCDERKTGGFCPFRARQRSRNSWTVPPRTRLPCWRAPGHRAARKRVRDRCTLATWARDFPGCGGKCGRRAGATVANLLRKLADGLRLTIELRETEIEALIRRGFLRAEMRNDPSAVSEALYAYFDRTYLCWTDACHAPRS
jgi:hypothetical protein